MLTDQDNGFFVFFELKNDGDQNIYLEGITPNNDAIQSLGLFLYLIESGNLYGEIIQEIKTLAKNKPELEEALKQALIYKNLLDNQLDTPTMRPSDVFNLRH